MIQLMKWAIYCRVSTEEQESQWTSLQSQKISCLKFANDNNLWVPEENIFLEQYSGWFLDRPQLTHLLLLASKWLIQFVIFMKRDRVARDQFVFQKIMKDLKDYNVKVFYSEEKLTGDYAMDDFMWSTIIWFAAWERQQIKLRTNIWKRQHAQNNKWIFWHVPYGYIKNPKTKELEIHEEEKKIVLQMVKYYLEDNMTMWEIAKKLTEDQVLPPTFSQKDFNEKLIEKSARKNSLYFWSISNVQRFFSRVRMYTGVYQAFKKEYQKTGNKSIFLWDAPKEKWIDIQIPQILNLKQVELIEEKLDFNRKYSKKRSVRSYMLQSKLFCNCESPQYHNFIGYFNNQKELRNYRCSLHNRTKFSDDRLCSNHISWRKIETVLIDTLKELFLDPEYIFEKAIDEYFWEDRKTDTKERYKELLQLIEESKVKMKRNEDAYIEGLIDKTSFIERKQVFQDKWESFQKELDKEEYIFKSNILKEQAKSNITQIAKSLKESIENFFDTATYDDLKELVSIVVDKVIVPKNKELPVRIIMKIPWYALNFRERYSEEQFATFIDDDDREYVVAKFWYWPKLLSLDPSKKPLKYRTVEFQNDDEETSFSHTQTEMKFLELLKKNFYKICTSDHFLDFSEYKAKISS